MIQTKLYFIILFFLSLMCFSNFVQIGQATLLEYSEGSDDAQEEFSKLLGTFTVGLLTIGFLYVLLTRCYVLIRKYVDKEYNPLIIETSRQIYSNFRKPMFYIHVTINIIAIFFGIAHGLAVEVKSELQANLGWLAVIIMIVLSVSGFIMWLKIKPIWNNKEIRSLIRTSHRQWILSFSLIIILLIHVY